MKSCYWYGGEYSGLDSRASKLHTATIFQSGQRSEQTVFYMFKVVGTYKMRNKLSQLEKEIYGLQDFSGGRLTYIARKML